MENFIYKTEVYEIVGACMEVHNYLGHGFLEVVYKDALEIGFVVTQLSMKGKRDF